MYAPAAQIAPVRVAGVEDPNQVRQITESLQGDIAQFFDAAQTQHQMSGQSFSHAQRRVGDLVLNYVNNGGQPIITVIPPGVDPDAQVDEPAPTDEIRVPPSPMLTERWETRWRVFRDITRGRDEPRVKYAWGVQPPQMNPPAGLVANAEDLLAQYNDPQAVIIYGRRLSQDGTTSLHIAGIFSWRWMFIGHTSQQAADDYDLNERPDFVALLSKPVEVIYRYRFWDEPWVEDIYPSQPAFTYPHAVKKDMWKLFEVLENMGPVLVHENPVLAPLESWLEHITYTFVSYQMPPLPGV